MIVNSRSEATLAPLECLFDSAPVTRFPGEPTKGRQQRPVSLHRGHAAARPGYHGGICLCRVHDQVRLVVPPAPPPRDAPAWIDSVSVSLLGVTGPPDDRPHAIPRRVYARLEAHEGNVPERSALDRDDATDAEFAFDAVCADWFDARTDSVLGLGERLDDYWTGIFAGGQSNTREDPNASVPIVHIELSLRPSHQWVPRLRALDDQWVELHLGSPRAPYVDVFRDPFDPEPQITGIAEAPERSSRAPQLSKAFGMGCWPDASPRDLITLFGYIPTIEQLISFDVGQGSANCWAAACECGLHSTALDCICQCPGQCRDHSCPCGCASCCGYLQCPCGFPICYFDLGCGTYRNARTRPQDIQFCNCSNAPVILSHWDADHWAGAYWDRRFLESRWIAPRQRIGPSHVKFASEILQSGGSILIVPDNARCVTWRDRRQSLRLSRATGNGRNSSGLIMQVRNRRAGKERLLTGDADYKHIPHRPDEVAAMTVPHHGASRCGVPPPRPSSDSASRLLYSFGPGNRHGRKGVSHPRPETVNALSRMGWTSPGWRPDSPGDGIAGGMTLATAQHSGDRRGWVGAGWDLEPAEPVHLMHCLGEMDPPRT